VQSEILMFRSVFRVVRYSCPSCSYRINVPQTGKASGSR
jgi:hypothetical protein